MKKHFFLIALCISAWAFADTPENYYVSVNGKSGDAILDALYSKVASHDDVGYDGLYVLYKYTDTDANGIVYDIYSSCNFTIKTDECSSGYKKVCDCYNREHTVPQSWFGSGKPKSDIFNVYPTDGKVNNQRGNYPYGECANGEKCDDNSKARGRLGASTFSGYSGKVFEPDDEFKGDLARSYFYMCAAYRTTTFLKSSEGEVVFTYNDKKTNLTQYAINLFMKWHREDPVSEKELKRNDAAYNLNNSDAQHNRNPFIDYPELAEYIWGNKKGEKVDLSKLKNAYSGVSYDYPIVVQPSSGTKIGFGSVNINEKSTQSFTLKAAAVTKDFTLTVSGTHSDFFVVSPSKVTAEQALAGQPVAVIYQPTQTGKHTATLTISSSEVVDVVMELSGTGRLAGTGGGDEMPDGDYVKVESTPSDWKGYYLIVNEQSGKALNGDRGNENADKSMISVEINDNTIVADETTNNAAFVIEEVSGGFTIKATDDMYYGITENGNKINISNEQILNDISISAIGDAIISGTGSLSERKLNYNTAGYFRYYTNPQKPVQLYKKTGNVPSELNNVVEGYTIRELQGEVDIVLTEPASVSVYDYMGRIVVTRTAVSNFVYALPQGLYIVRIGQKAEKVLVR